MSIETRLAYLEERAEDTGAQWICAECRRAGSPSPCRHYGMFLALVPRIEYASAAEWQRVRESGQQALARTSTEET